MIEFGNFDSLGIIFSNTRYKFSGKPNGSQALVNETNVKTNRLLFLC